MAKKIFLFILLGLTFLIESCSNDDNKVVVDKDWKALNEQRFREYANKPNYYSLSSQSGDGKIYWTPSNLIVDNDNEKSGQMTDDKKPEFTDTIVVRYEGWFLDKDGEQMIFDSTENPSMSSRIDYQQGMSSSIYPNHKLIKMPVSGITDPKKPQNKLIDGWITALQDMKEGEEREIVIPQELAYGSNQITHTVTKGNGSLTFVLAPSYTTLWFRIKLMQIIPMVGKSS